MSEYNASFQVTVTDANHFSIDTPFLDNHSVRGHWMKGRPFALSASHGDDLWLVETNSMGQPVRFIDHVDFDGSFNGVALGRWPNGGGSGTLISMSQNTLGAANLGAMIGPVVISEIMYSPASGDHLEFVEIYNSGTITEYLDHWKLRGGADFNFTATHSIAPGGVLVLVPFDPDEDGSVTASFRSHYAIDEEIALVGPFTDGPLGDDTGTVRLQRPDSPPASEPDFYPQVTEDEVTYFDHSPWPVAVAGGGLSLNRISAGLFGGFASSWTALDPTPGGSHSDYDGWNAFWDVGSKSDDFDGDGVSNIVEFALGMNPKVSDGDQVPVSVIEGENVTFTFSKNTLLHGVGYRVEWSTDLILWNTTENTQLSTLNFEELRIARILKAPHHRIFMRLVIEY